MTGVELANNKVVLSVSAPPDLSPGNYASRVTLVTLEKGGRSPAHKHGGIESIYVLEGTLDLRMAGGARVILNRGQGAAVPPGTVLQAVNGGDTVAKFLAFNLTSDEAPFMTGSDQAP
ncbi:MAG: cupin domain-containing protein [Chloroflexota bacterium]|nr:cupin domain-containing protein [Chloroflexota bacterium]